MTMKPLWWYGASMLACTNPLRRSLFVLWLRYCPIAVISDVTNLLRMCAHCELLCCIIDWIKATQATLQLLKCWTAKLVEISNEHILFGQASRTPAVGEPNKNGIQKLVVRQGNWVRLFHAYENGDAWFVCPKAFSMRSTLRCHANPVLSKHAQALIAQLPLAPPPEEVRPTFVDILHEIEFRLRTQKRQCHRHASPQTMPVCALQTLYAPKWPVACCQHETVDGGEGAAMATSRPLTQNLAPHATRRTS